MSAEDFVVAAADNNHQALVEALARYLEPSAFEGRRRSSRNQHAANKCQTYARRTAKRIAKWRLLPALAAAQPLHQAASAAAINKTAKPKSPTRQIVEEGEGS